MKFWNRNFGAIINSFGGIIIDLRTLIGSVIPMGKKQENVR